MPPRRRTPTVRVSSSQQAMRVPRKRIAALVAFVAGREGVRIADVDVAVVTRDEMARLNRRYAGRRGTTDVLSFDLSDVRSEGISAQIVVCGDVASEQAARHGCGEQRELLLYVVHGLLHLMGYEDSSVRGAAKIRARQDELLDEFAGPRGKRR